MHCRLLYSVQSSVTLHQATEQALQRACSRLLNGKRRPAPGLRSGPQQAGGQTVATEGGPWALAVTSFPPTQELQGCVGCSAGPGGAGGLASWSRQSPAPVPPCGRLGPIPTARRTGARCMWFRSPSESRVRWRGERAPAGLDPNSLRRVDREGFSPGHDSWPHVAGTL